MINSNRNGEWYGYNSYRGTQLFNKEIYTPSCLRNLVQAYTSTRKIQLKHKRSTYTGHSESDDAVLFAPKICKPSNLTVVSSTFILLIFVARLNQVTKLLIMNPFNYCAGFGS